MELTKTEYKLTFLFAVLCSMNGLMIAGFSFSNYILVFLLVYTFFFNRTNIVLNFNGQSSKFSWLMLLSIFLSILAALPILPYDWLGNSILSLIKFLLAYGYFFLIQPNVKINEFRSVFFKGFYIGAIIQLIWGFLQELLYISAGIKLNTLIFSDILGQTSYNWDSYISGNILRMTGLGWEAANFALVMVVGYVISCHLKKSLIVRLLFITAIFFSTSRSGYVALLAVLVVQFLQILKRSTFNFKITYKKLLVMVFLLSGVSIILFIFKDSINSRLQIIIQSFENIFHENDINSSANIHMGYYKTLIDSFKQLPIINSLFGIGYFSSGYFYDQHALELGMSPLLLNYKFGWNPESDFVTLVIGNGILGAIIYYGFAIKGFVKHIKDHYSLLIVAVITCGITYLTIRGTWSGLVLAFSLNDIINKKG